MFRPLVVLPLALALAAPPAVSAAVPGGNGRIAFAKIGAPTKAKRGPASSILSVRPNGGSTVKLGGKKGFIASSPEYSPDGSKVAYILGRYGRESKLDGLYVANSDGRKPKLLARVSWTNGFAWSPDGQTLVYDDAVDGIHLIPAAGGESKLIVPVLDDGGFFSVPTFSPDGSTILFERDKLSDNADGKAPRPEKREIWRAGVDGSDARPLALSGAARLVGEPDISPDGASIVFLAAVDKAVALCTAPLDGSAPPRKLYVARKDRWLDGPSWSPDGKQIVVAEGKDGAGSSVFLLDAASGAKSTIARSKSSEFTDPTWQPLPAAARYRSPERVS